MGIQQFVMSSCAFSRSGVGVVEFFLGCVRLVSHETQFSVSNFHGPIQSFTHVGQTMAMPLSAYSQRCENVRHR